MKTGCMLVQCCAFLGAALLLARADDQTAPASPVQGPPPSPSPNSISPKGPWLQSFPPVKPDISEAPTFDGSTGETSYGGASGATEAEEADAERVAEQTYAANQAKKDHPDDNALDQSARQQAYANDWLLRDYNAQLKKRGLEKTDYANPFLVPAPLDPTKPQVTSTDPLLDQPEKKTPAKNTHKPSPFDDSSTLTPKKSLTPLSFQPLLAPLTPSAMSTHSSVSLTGLEQVMPQPETGASLLPIPNGNSGNGLPASNDNSIASLLDVPGLTAATQGGIAPNNAVDFDEPAPSSGDPAHRDNFLAPTAPTSDVSEFFKKQSEALAPPTANGMVPTVAQVTRPRLIVNPEPTAKPVLSPGIRSHVSDPFDILQR